MSNTIQIKRGPGAPGTKLAANELGYDTTNGYLYIGQESASAIKIKAGQADVAASAVTALRFSEGCGSNSEPIYIDERGQPQVCTNLPSGGNGGTVDNNALNSFISNNFTKNVDFQKGLLQNKPQIRAF